MRKEKKEYRSKNNVFHDIKTINMYTMCTSNTFKM